jgi:hypothetical protein
LTGENSYDLDGDRIEYLWIYDRNQIKTSRDPGAFVYGLGDHEIVLRTIDPLRAYGEDRIMIRVVAPETIIDNKKEKPPKVSTTKKPSKILKKYINNIPDYIPPIDISPLYIWTKNSI